MRLGIAKVDQQAIAEILRNMPVEALDDLGTGLLIGAHHLAVVFRIELTGKAGRVDQVTEQHRELAAFGGRLGMRGSGRRSGWRNRWGGCTLPRPEEAAALVIHDLWVGVEECVLQVFEVGVVQIELSFQGAIRHPLFLLEPGDHLGQHLFEGHAAPLLPCLQERLGLRRSAVSKPSVNQP